jgi:HNH endonuclease
MPSTFMPCMICGDPITPGTDSKDHAIPNSVGGWLKVPDFVHADCDNQAGETWDAELSKQMHALCLIFGVVRERGETQPLKTVTTAGEKLTIQPDGSLKLTDPKFSKTPTEQGAAISFTARDEKEARTMLTGLKRTFPNLDVEGLLAQAERVTSYPEGLVHHEFTFGGEQGGRSMVKTAAAFARYLGVPTTACDVAAAYLRDEKAKPPFGYYFVADLIENRPIGVPFHCVAVSGDPQTGLLLAYVEYFGAVRIVACLSENYGGPKVNGSYAVDPTSGNTLDLKVAMPFDRTELQAIYNYERAPLEGHKAALDAVLGPAMARQQQEAQNIAVADAVEYAFANCGAKPGDMLTPEQKRRLPGLVTQRLMPYLQRRMVRPDS